MYENVYSDFYLPDYDTYIEFWGMPDDPGYAANMERKKAIYARAGFDLVSIEPSDLDDLSTYLGEILQLRQPPHAYIHVDTQTQAPSRHRSEPTSETWQIELQPTVRLRSIERTYQGVMSDIVTIAWENPGTQHHVEQYHIQWALVGESSPRDSIVVGGLNHQHELHNVPQRKIAVIIQALVNGVWGPWARLEETEEPWRFW